MIWHKVCWPSRRSPSGFAAHGGMVRQVQWISEIFDQTRVVAPCSASGDREGERWVLGHNVSVVSLPPLAGPAWRAWVLLPWWLLQNGRTLVREMRQADAVFPVVPSPLGTVALFLTVMMRKPLLVRPMNVWSEPRLLWRLERALLEIIAGGRNVVFATGESAAPPSKRNPAIRWIFSTTISEAELNGRLLPRRLGQGPARLIIVGRQLETEGTRIILRALKQLSGDLPALALDVVGHGAALADMKRLAAELEVLDRVTFHGAATHEGVLELLQAADLFCLPTAETDSVRQAIHEALVCGLPVIAEETPLLDGVRCGVILKKRTPEAFATAVRACLSDPQAYQRMSAEALRRARSYTLELWRDTIRDAVQEAWGPLKSARDSAPADAAVARC